MLFAQVNNGTHRYWINGEKMLVKPVTNRIRPVQMIQPLSLLELQGGGGIRYFLGMIDEVRIWNRALSDEEINEQMEKGHFEISPVDPKSKLTITWGNLKVQQR